MEAPMAMCAKKLDRPEVLIIRPDGKQWEMDQSADAVERALAEAMERARLWRRLFGADLLDMKRPPRPGLRGRRGR